MTRIDQLKQERNGIINGTCSKFCIESVPCDSAHCSTYRKIEHLSMLIDREEKLAASLSK